MSIRYADQSDACDLTERAAFSIGSGSVKVRKYTNCSVQFRFALCDFEKHGLGQVRLRFDKISVKPVYKTPIRVRFDSVIFAFEKTSIINTLDSFEKSFCFPEAFRDALVK